MNPLEYAGHPDPKAEKAGERAQKEALDDIEQEIDPEDFKEIIHTLENGNVSDLSPRLLKIVKRLREERGGSHH